MPNPYHDETGKFCSRREMAAAAERLARGGRVEEALALSDELKQLEDARFESAVNLGSLSRRVGAFFARGTKSAQPAGELQQPSAVDEGESELPPLPAGRFAMEDERGGQHEFQEIDRQRYPNVRGFYAVGDKQQEAESLARFEAVDAVWGLQAEGEQALSQAILAGVPPYIPEQTRYFHNAELRESVPDLSAWKAQSGAQGYVVGKMVEAMVSQRTAAFQNAGLEVDPAVAAISPEEDVETMVLNKNPAALDEGLISNFDEGWLCAYQRAVTAASQLPFDDDDDQEGQLAQFVASQRDLWEGRYAASNSAFDGGGADAFSEDNWSELS